MKLIKSKRNSDAKKASELGEQSKAEKKSTTFEQRGRQALGVATMAFLALARGTEAMNGEGNQVSNQVKKLVDGMPPSSKSLAERYGPAMPPEAFSHYKSQTIEELWPRLHEQVVKALGEKGQASKFLVSKGRY